MRTRCLKNLNLEYIVIEIKSGTAVRLNSKNWTTKTRKIVFKGMRPKPIKTTYKQFRFNTKPTKVQAPVIGSCKMPSRKLKGETNKTVKGFIPRYSYKHNLKLQNTRDLQRWNELDEALRKENK